MAREYGTIYFSLDGENLSVKGDVTFNISGGTKSFEANMDGSLHSKFERAPYTAEISAISGSSTSLIRLRELFRRCSNDGNGLTAIFDLTGECSGGSATTFTFVDASVGGNISLSGQSGEISGLMIASANLQIAET